MTQMSDELYHHGVKGMKWGVRKQRRTENSAARAHFKTENSKVTSKKYQKASRKKSLNEAKLSSTEVKKGRYRVAKVRAIKRNAASITLGALTGSRAAAAGLGVAVATGGAAIPAMLAAGGTVGLATAIGAHYATGAHYYGKQRKAYKKGLKNSKASK